MRIQHFLALVVLSLATVPGARAAVLAGPLTNAANAHTYYLLSSNTWTASEAEAVGLGGHLVTINDAAENQWVLNTFFPLTGVPYASLWIGLNDAANEGQFVWASGEPVAFTYWYPGEPNNAGLGGEDYATIRHPSEAPPTGSWNDLANTPSAPTLGVVEVWTPLPVAVTQPADQFMPGSARLNGLANPNGSPTLAWFEWGTSLAYGNVTPPQSVGSGSNAVGLSNVIVGLVSGTDYHFRARASNAFGSLAGLDQTFNLNTQRPVVTTLAADQLTTNSARLRGQVNPRGSPTAAWFEWGTDTNYGNLIGTQDVGQGSSASNLNVVLNGLTTGTNYHYRLVATNAFGAVYGANQTFNPAQRPPTTITWTGTDPSGHWSAPANWSPTGVPVNGDALVFPGGLPPGDMVSTNDLTDRIFRSITFGGAGGHTIRGNPITLTNRTDCIIHSGTNVIDCDLTFSGTPATPTFTTIRSSSFGSGELTMTGNVGGGSLYAFGGRLVIRGQFTGGTLRQYGGTLAFYGDHSHAVSVEFQGDSSTLFVQGSQPNLNITLLWEMESAACPHFTGNGVVGDVFGCGHIILDSTLSVKSLGGSGASQYGWRALDIRLNGTNVGEYGRLISSGDVTLTGGSLSASPGFNPQPGQVFTIVDKTSPGPITTVPGYDTTLFGPEGKIITLNGMPFRLSYVGGDGNDVTLTANTPPAVTWQQPANNAAFPPGFTISLRARATDSDGTVSNLDFFVTPTNGPAINVGQGTLASDGYYVRGWTNPPPGQYQLHAEAVDNAGGRGISDSVQIVVVDTSQPPTNAQTRTWTGADPSGYWSAPANWSPAGVLVNGDALVFPGGLPPGDMVSTNDLTDRFFRSITFSGASRHTIRGHPITLTNSADVILNTGTNVIACDLTFTGTPPTPTYGSPRIASSSFNSGELTVIGNVESGSLYIGLGFWRLVIMGQFTGRSLFIDWYTTVALYGDNPYVVSVTNVAGTLLVQGSQPNLNMSLYYNLEDPSWRASLSGDGLVGDVADFGSSRITPDSTLSIKNISGGGSGPATLIIRLNGTNVGEYGRLVASGNVSLSGGSLLPSAGFNPQPGQVFTIVEKTSPGPITGAITNAPFGPEGKMTNLNGMPFRISYVGGDGNDLTLTATPPRLDIARTSPAQVRLSWSTNYPGFNLQRASAIDGSASWSNHPTSRVVMGSNYTVTQPAATNREFFRLKQP